MSTWAILLAAGGGQRLQAATGGVAKQYLACQGRPLYWRSALTLRGLAWLSGLVFVVPDGDRDRVEAEIRGLWVQDQLGLPWLLASGGPRRQDSVANGLAVLPADCRRVLVHDAARPFFSAALARRLHQALDQAPAAIPALPVKDTIKETDGEQVVATLDRSRLVAVQTPQAFHLDVLRQAHAAGGDWDATDDASLVERLGLPVLLLPGEERNQKITTPEDLALLTPSAHAAPSAIPLSCLGYDVHKYVDPAAPKARPMKLGGVPIPNAPCVAAHSDGDVLLHALCDAMLSLLGQGDIGARYPDSDPAFDNLESAVFVHEILEDVLSAGLELTHVDLTIVAQVPRLAPYREAMAKNVALLLKIPPGRVNVKATTEEGLGFTGEKRGIKAYALVSALRPATECDTAAHPASH